MEMLRAVGVENLANRHLGTLSGGEQQRVLLALALQEHPELLILDEPASGVDFHGEQILCALLDRLRIEHGFTQLMVSHDLALVTAHADHVICLNRKVVGEGSPQQVLTPGVLEATFGIHLGLPDPRRLPEECVLQERTRRCEGCPR
jgi:zinc transport system ATP-binding protein